MGNFMEINRLSILLVIMMILTSCTTTSKIVPAGPGKYMLSGGNLAIGASGAEIKTELYKKASDFCMAQGKIFEPVDSSSVDYQVFHGTANAEVTFRCIQKEEN